MFYYAYSFVERQWNPGGRKKGLVEWIRSESPDLLCLQETKARPDQVSEELAHPVDDQGTPYRAYWASAKRPGYSGVVIYSKAEPLDGSYHGVSGL